MAWITKWFENASMLALRPSSEVCYGKLRRLEKWTLGVREIRQSAGRMRIRGMWHVSGGKAVYPLHSEFSIKKS